MANDGRPIGKLRWPVVVIRRTQIPDAVSSGIIEGLQGGYQTWASIEQLRSLTFYEGVQIDLVPTHRIVMRWIAAIDTNFVVLRAMNYPDRSPVLEIFRLERRAEDDGRFRFLLFDAVLERQIPP